MNVRTAWRLGGMMALIYAVQGAWWPVLAIHLTDLGVSSRGRSWIFATFSIGAILTPLGAGQLADRLMPTQRMLSLIYGLGTGLLTLFALGLTNRAEVFFPLFLGYWFLIAPAYGLSNSLAMRNLTRPRQQFGAVRLWGTIGWMLIGLAVTGVVALHDLAGTIAPGVHDAFWVAAGLSALFSAYCWTLPHTPPLNTGSRPGLDLGATLELTQRPSVGVLLVILFGASMTQPFVYQVVPTYLDSVGLSRTWMASAMSLSQVLEVVALATLPACLRRFGYRGTMGIGLGAWVVYFLSFSTGPSLALALLSLPVTGLGVGCLIISGQMYLDEQAPPDRRASAQALHIVMTSGLGAFCGSLLAGELMARNGGVGGPVFAIPCLIDIAMLLLVIGWFRPQPLDARTPTPAILRERSLPVVLAAGKLAPGAGEV